MIRTRRIERFHGGKTSVIRFLCFAEPCCQRDAEYLLIVEWNKPHRKRPQTREYPLCERHARHYAAKYAIPMPEGVAA